MGKPPKPVARPGAGKTFDNFWCKEAAQNPTFIAEFNETCYV
jgi:hypothetical protein